jgi:hypothetical protein
VYIARKPLGHKQNELHRSMRKTTCGYPEGSGYVKQSDPTKAAEVEMAYAAALAARTTLDSYWVTPTPAYDPCGSNAQPGWPSCDVSESCVPIYERTDIEYSFERMMAARILDDKKWQSTPLDPCEFTGLDETGDTKHITIDVPLLDISGFVLDISEGNDGFDVIQYE